MLIKMKQDKGVCGQHCGTGEIIDAPEPDALRLLGMDAAERYTAPVPAPEIEDESEDGSESDPGEIVNADPAPINADPKPRKR